MCWRLLGAIRALLVPAYTDIKHCPIALARISSGTFVVNAHFEYPHWYAYLGHALWRPKVQEKEIEIGDVGFFHEGGFKQLFNVFSAQGLPEGCEPLRGFDTRLQDDNDQCLPAGPLSSETVKVTKALADAQVSAGMPMSPAAGVEFVFDKSTREGAVLCLAEGAKRRIVFPNKAFKKYMLHNWESWRAYLDRIDLDIDPLELILVRGWVKTSAWAMAAFQTEARAVGGYLKGGWNVARLGAGWRFEEQQSMLLQCKQGPISAFQDYNRSLLSITDQLSQDQCIFLCYYKMKYRFGLFPRIIQAAAGPATLPEGEPEAELPSVLSSDAMEVDTESQPPPKAVTPVDIVLDYILRNSDAKVAIACDGDIEGLFPGSQDWPTDLKEYLSHNLPRIEVDEDGVGTLSVEDAIRSGQLRRRTLAQQQQNEQQDMDDGLDSKLRPAASTERVTLADGKTLQWLPLILSEGPAEGISINGFATSDNSKRILTASDNYNVKLWDRHSGELLHEFLGHEDAVLTVAFSPGGDQFVSGSADCKAIIWDVASGNSIATLNKHEAWVWCALYSPDGKIVATGGFDQTVCLWSPTGQLKHALGDHEAQITILQFSPDGNLLLACTDNVVALWENVSASSTDAPHLRTTLRGHENAIWGMRFSHAGDRIVTCSDDMTSRIWNVETGVELLTLREHSGPVWAVDFSPDDLSVVSGSYDATISVCDSFSTETRFTIRERPAKVHSLAYAHDGQYIVSGDADGLVKVWDALTGAFVAEFKGHEDKVKVVAWTPDDKSILSSSDDGSVRVWDFADLLRI